MVYSKEAFSPSNNLAPRLPHSPLPVIKLDRRYTGRARKRDKLLTGERGEGGGRGAESYDRKKARSSIKHSILSAQAY
jgi:hypothetical protein